MSDVVPIWKKKRDEGRLHGRRTWSAADGENYKLAKEKYREVIESVMDGGLSWQKACLNAAISARVGALIVKRWQRTQKSLKLKRGLIADGKMAEEITARGWERIHDAVIDPEGISVERYNQIKVIQTHLKGQGVYRSGDAVGPANDNRTYNFIVNMSPEDRQKFIVDGERKLRLTGSVDSIEIKAEEVSKESV